MDGNISADPVEVGGSSEKLGAVATRKPFQLHWPGMERKKKWDSISHMAVVFVSWISEKHSSVAPRRTVFHTKKEPFERMNGKPEYLQTQSY